MSHGALCVPSTKTIRLTTLIEITASIIIPRMSPFATFRIPRSPNHDIPYHKLGSTRNVANKLWLISNLGLWTGGGGYIQVFWHVIPRRFVSSSRRFEWSYSVHHFFNRVILKMTAIGSFETSATTYETTQCNIPEDLNLQQHRSKHLTSCKPGSIPTQEDSLHSS
jgi:hypothetical protein